MRFQWPFFQNICICLLICQTRSGLAYIALWTWNVVDVFSMCVFADPECFYVSVLSIFVVSSSSFQWFLKLPLIRYNIILLFYGWYIHALSNHLLDFPLYACWDHAWGAFTSCAHVHAAHFCTGFWFHTWLVSAQESIIAHGCWYVSFNLIYYYNIMAYNIYNILTYMNYGTLLFIMAGGGHYCRAAQGF